MEEIGRQELEEGELKAREMELQFHRNNIKNVPLSDLERKSELWEKWKVLNQFSKMKWGMSIIRNEDSRRCQFPIVIQEISATITSDSDDQFEH